MAGRIARTITMVQNSTVLANGLFATNISLEVADRTDFFRQLAKPLYEAFELPSSGQTFIDGTIHSFFLGTRLIGTSAFSRHRCVRTKNGYPAVISATIRSSYSERGAVLVPSATRKSLCYPAISTSLALREHVMQIVNPVRPSHCSWKRKSLNRLAAQRIYMEH